PKKFPIIGNLHQLGPLPHHSLHKLAAKHGPLMHLQLGQIPTIIVSSPELASQILKTHDHVFCNRPSTPAFLKFTYGGLDIAASKHGEHWRQLRKFCMLELFSKKRVQSFKKVREDEVHVLIQSIRHSCSQDENQLVNLSEMLFCMSNNITGRQTFGKRFSKEGECHRSELHDLMRETLEVVGELSIGDFFPCLQYLINVVTGFHGKLERSFKKVDELWEREIERHYLHLSTDDHEHEEEKEDNFLDVLLNLHKDSTDNLGFSFTRDHVKAILADMFFAGTETTAATLEWALSELMRNPRVMKKVKNEVQRVTGIKEKVEESDVQGMKYLRLVINETLRLHPLGPLLIPRESVKECMIDGYDIPPTTRAFVNAWAIMRDPNLWDDPEIFFPERFEGSVINYKGHHFQFIPFGAGLRMCPGWPLSIANINIALANLLYFFNWKLPEGKSEIDIDMTESFGISVHKKLPLILMATST
ncbi:Premnaspirodiene oxygenase protein, partial [Dioscorea alata]